MYYFEIRFNTKNKKFLTKSIIDLEKRLEIISIYEDDYYICYRLKSPIDEEILTELKKNIYIYFLTHYLI